MKRIYALLLTLVLCISLVACGNSGSGGASSQTEKSDPSELTLKTATETDTRVWFTTENLDGRNTVIDGVYYFKDGKVTAYIPRLYGWAFEDQLGTLEDYYGLSDEEAIALAKERYEAFYEDYKDIEKKESYVLEEYAGRYDSLPDWEEQKAAFDSTVEKLKNEKIIEKAPADIKYLMKLDESGNSVTGEAISFQYEVETTHNGQLYTYAGGGSLYETVEPYQQETYLAADEMIEPFEVYDTCFGGFAGYLKETRVIDTPETRTIYALTKCGKDTSFVFDEPGTEGIEVMN